MGTIHGTNDIDLGHDPWADHGTPSDAVAGASWRPIDLGPILRGEHVRPDATVGIARQDGVRLFYPGKEHAIVGKMETGKSWLAVASCAAELTNGHHVIYIHFEEDDAADTVFRLLALGVPPDVIGARFHFVAPTEPADLPTIAAVLLALAPSLVILDGVNEAMALHGQKINDTDGAAAYRSALVKPFTRAGAAVVSLDHLPHTDDGRRSAIGSVHKGNGINGSLVMLEAVEAFGEERRGCSRVFVTKDRPGRLRRHGRPDDKVPGKTYMGSLIVDDTREHHDYLDLVLIPPADDDMAKAARQKTPTETLNQSDEDAVFAAVAEITNKGGAPASQRTVEAHVTGMARARVRNALARLALKGRLTQQDGPRGSYLFDVPKTGPATAPGADAA